MVEIASLLSDPDLRLLNILIPGGMDKTRLALAAIWRQYDITESLAYKWRDQFLEQAPDIFKDHRQKEQAVAEWPG